MQPYRHIDSIFKRDVKGKMLWGDYSTPELAFLADNEWIGYEKIDGTNIRVIWNPFAKKGPEFTFMGKTDKADTPKFLLESLEKIFEPLICEFDKLWPDTEVCFYGEGYGQRIQDVGKLYLPTSNSFTLFDIKIGNFWLHQANIEEIATIMDLTVPKKMFCGTLTQAIKFVEAKPKSLIANCTAEGLILRLPVQLFDRRGERIITKLKVKDFKNNPLP